MRKEISMKQYERKASYEAFYNHDIPTVGTTCEIDISPLHKIHKEMRLKFFPLIAFLINRSINRIPQFRHRIINDKLYEIDITHPAFTVLLDNETISFCDSRYFEKPKDFYNYTLSKIEEAKNKVDLHIKDKDEFYFISNIPWIKFTSFTHPYISKYSSIPIITIGKYETHKDKTMIPIAIQAHHSLVDGLHLAKFFNLIEKDMKNIDHVFIDFS